MSAIVVTYITFVSHTDRQEHAHSNHQPITAQNRQLRASHAENNNNS